MSPDGKLRSSSRLFLAGILLAALGLRITHYAALANGPCLIPHQASDMAFFEAWSSRIATEDVWTDTALHPLHSWHLKVALDHLRKHPESLGGVAEPAGSPKPVGVDPATLDPANLDPAEQERRARALWNSWYGQKTFHQEPLYPYALALGKSLFGSERTWLHFAQMLLGLAGIALAFAVTRAYFGSAAGLCAAALMAGSGPLMFFELQVLRAGPIAFATLALLGCIAWAGSSPTPKRLTVLGAAIGAAALLKLHFAACGGLVLLLFGLGRGRSDRVPPKSLLWAVIGGLVASLPLLIRNLVVGAPLLSSTSVGPVTFANTNHAAYNGCGWAESTTALSTLSDVMSASDGRFLASVTGAISSHEGLSSYLALLWTKFGWIWHWAELPNNVNYYFAQSHAPLLSFMPTTFTVLSCCAAIGLFEALRRQSLPLPLLTFLTVGILQFTSFYTLARLRCGLAAALLPLAGLGLVAVYQMARAKQFRLLVPILMATGLLAWWMQRPLPQPEVLQNSASYSNAMNNYYRPAWRQVVEERDWERGHSLMQGAIDARPTYLDAIDTKTLPKTRSQWNVTGLYAEVYSNLATCLKATQRAGEAAVAQARSTALTQAWRRVETMLKQR